MVNKSYRYRYKAEGQGYTSWAVKTVMPRHVHVKLLATLAKPWSVYTGIYSKPKQYGGDKEPGTAS